MLPFLKKYKTQIVIAVIAMLVMSVTDLLVPQKIRTIIDEGIAKQDVGTVIRSSG